MIFLFFIFFTYAMHKIVVWCVFASGFFISWVFATWDSPVLEVFDVNTFDGTEKVYSGTWGDIYGREKIVARPVPTIKEISEVERAFWYLHTIWATKYSAISEFAGNDYILREHMAKMLLQRGNKVSVLTTHSEYACDFSDLYTADMSLQDALKETCKFWVLRGHNKLIHPKNTVHRWDFFMAVLRVLWIDVNEDTVYDKAATLWLTTVSFEAFDYYKPITRTQASLILYRAALDRSDLTAFHATPISEYYAKAGYGTMLADSWEYTAKALSISPESVMAYADTASISIAWAGSALMDREVTTDVALNWWEVDDNILFDAFSRYYTEAQTKFGDQYTYIDLNNRYHLTSSVWYWGTQLLITDAQGSQYYVSLDTKGEFYFYPGSYVVDSGPPVSDTYTVTVVWDTTPYSQTFNANTTGWELNLPTSMLNNQKILQLAFIIDTTGSMWDQIKKIKDTISSVVQRVKEQSPDLSIEYGLVAYKDKYDEYVTATYQFTPDLEKYQGFLDGLQASGGGDYPEDVNAALEEAMEYLHWSDAVWTYGLAFLVADAPPHMDYNQTYDYRVAMLRAVEQWVKIYPVASSGLDNTVWELIFRQISLVTNARYIFITKGANGTTDYHIDQQDYSVESLDDLIVDVILSEL